MTWTAVWLWLQHHQKLLSTTSINKMTFIRRRNKDVQSFTLMLEWAHTHPAVKAQTQRGIPCLCTFQLQTATVTYRLPAAETWLHCSPDECLVVMIHSMTECLDICCMCLLQQIAKLIRKSNSTQEPEKLGLALMLTNPLPRPPPPQLVREAWPSGTMRLQDSLWSTEGLMSSGFSSLLGSVLL